MRLQGALWPARKKDGMGAYFGQARDPSKRFDDFFKGIRREKERVRGIRPIAIMTPAKK